MGNAGIVAEMARVEPARLHSYPATALVPAFAAEIAATQPKPPTLLLSTPAVFDDGVQRLELMYLGDAHTAVDTVAWLPKHRVLVTGDVAVNGPYNVMWDAHVMSWIDVLTRLNGLGAQFVVPGHGPFGTGSIIGDQLAYFSALRDAVKAVVEQGAMRLPSTRRSNRRESGSSPILASSGT
jgi:cyclase